MKKLIEIKGDASFRKFYRKKNNHKNSIIAKNNGVKFIAFSCDVSKKGISVIQQVNINEN